MAGKILQTLQFFEKKKSWLIICVYSEYSPKKIQELNIIQTWQ